MLDKDLHLSLFIYLFIYFFLSFLDHASDVRNMDKDCLVIVRNWGIESVTVLMKQHLIHTLDA